MQIPMSWIILYLILFILFLGLAFLAAELAPKRNQSAGLWFFLTFIFPIAILFIAMKDIDPLTERQILEAKEAKKEHNVSEIKFALFLFIGLLVLGSAIVFFRLYL